MAQISKNKEILVVKKSVSSQPKCRRLVVSVACLLISLFIYCSVGIGLWFPGLLDLSLTELHPSTSMFLFCLFLKMGSLSSPGWPRTLCYLDL